MADAPMVARKPTPVTWYRSPLEREAMKQLLERSDLRALAQTFPHLALIALTGTATCLAIMQPGRWFGAWNPWWLLAVAPLLLMHGFLCSFAINAVHELGHGTVFKTKWLNRLFEGVFAFIGWIHHEQFTVSHTRHHRYTLHYPDDQEEVLPKKWDRLNALKWNGIFDWRILKNYVNNFHYQWRVARGSTGFEGAWNEVLFPADQPELRRPMRRWAVVLLVGHTTVLIGSIALGWWPVALVVSMTGSYGHGVQGLMNNTQHIGMMKDVPDARLCCRTFTAHPVLQYFYWHMNFHIEHHMYAAVPCYRLAALHRTIIDDLPATPHGIFATWREIEAIQEKQAEDPTYEQRPVIPARKSHADLKKPSMGDAIAV